MQMTDEHLKNINNNNDGNSNEIKPNIPYIFGRADKNPIRLAIFEENAPHIVDGLLSMKRTNTHSRCCATVLFR